MLVITKQPGANVIETVDAIKAALPRAAGGDPADGQRQHRWSTARRPSAPRSSDVEFTLMLTIALVVLVIFVFLRNVPATLIPSVTVPLALLGTAAVMYLVGYSLDNLSLMALTIAVGFVVDDAIVMLENIYRHVEDGMAPMEAALQGRRRDRLHHHLDLGLAGRGVHPAAADGRHRRPAVPRVRGHRDADHRGLGADLADADADAVLALPEERARGARTAASTSSSSAASTRC